MNRDRIIQLAAVGVIIVGLALSMLVAPIIRGQRRELNIVGTVNREELAPQYALATAALGSFRGIAIDALWYRTEHLQQAGKFFQANTLANWITTLQPRFPQVWLFQSWNMAYNISVETHTPEERWDWVERGIRLLRNRGLVYNPQAVALYRQLAWTFLHKIGMASDNMHWYYKIQLALRWQQLLGAPTSGADTQQVLARFAPIADMAEKYFRFNQPTRAEQKEMSALIETYPALKDDLERMRKMAPADLAPLIQQKISAWRTAHPEIVQPLENIGQQVEDQVARSKRVPANEFLEDYPNAQPVVSQLRSMGLKLDQGTLLHLGSVRMLMRYVPPQALPAVASEQLSANGKQLLDLMQNPSLHAGVLETLDFLRAKVLTKDYNMDPVFMYELMRKFGPVDWRSPDAQALYWYSLGVERGHDMGANPGFDLLNTDRGVIHSLQSLMNQGKVVFHPFPGSVDLLPDTRFIPAYAKALKATKALATSRGMDVESMSSFDMGYENFMGRALILCYFYGSNAQAEKYYHILHTQFAHSMYNKTTGAYNLPMSNLVMKLMARDLGQRTVSRGFIGGMLRTGFKNGLGNGKPNIYRQFQDLAQVAYQQYQAKNNSPTPGAPRDSQSLPPFSRMVIDTFTQLMQDSGLSLFERARIYNNSPEILRKKAYGTFISDVTAQAKQQHMNVDALFPPPPGVSQEKIQPKSDLGPSTIMRH